MNTRCKSVLAFTAGALLLWATSAWAGVIVVNEGFEDPPYPVVYDGGTGEATVVPDSHPIYGPTAWGMDSALPGAANVIVQEDGFGVAPDGTPGVGQSIRHNGGKTIRHNFGQHIFPNNSDPLIVQFDVYDSGATSGTARIGLQLSDVRYQVDALSALFTMALTNLAGNNAVDGSATSAFGYAFRAVNMSASYNGDLTNINGKHVRLPGVEGRTANLPEWVRMRAEIGKTKMWLYVDRGIDGTWDNTGGVTEFDIVLGGTFQGWYQVSLGGLGSASSNFAFFDNVYVETPEPASLVLLGLGAMLIRRRRRLA